MFQIRLLWLLSIWLHFILYLKKGFALFVILFVAGPCRHLEDSHIEMEDCTVRFIHQLPR